MKYTSISDQRYYICPNIDKIKNENSILCKGMKFECLDFNTVFIHINKCYKNKDFEKEEKNSRNSKKDEKTLVYTQSQSNIKKVCEILVENTIIENSNALLEKFCKMVIKILRRTLP